MVIQLQRDPGFWADIAGRLEARAGTLGLSPAEVGALAGLEAVTPLASANGGFLFARLDALGAIWELHALYARAGWGREAHGAGRAALAHVFAGGALLVMAFEWPGNAGSRPPRSFGFRRVGPAPAGAQMLPGCAGGATLWMLTRAAWEASPAGRRLAREETLVRRG